EAERVEGAAHDARPLAIARAQPLLPPGCRRDRRQVRHRVLAAEPTARVEVEVPLRPARTLLQLGRKGGADLEPGVGHHPAPAPPPRPSPAGGAGATRRAPAWAAVRPVSLVR